MAKPCQNKILRPEGEVFFLLAHNHSGLVGRALASHAVGPGSILGPAIVFFQVSFFAMLE